MRLMRQSGTWCTIKYVKRVKERPRDPRGSLTKSVRQFVARNDICGKHFAAVNAFARAIYKHEKIRMRRLVGRGSFEIKTEKRQDCGYIYSKLTFHDRDHQAPVINSRIRENTVEGAWVSFFLRSQHYPPTSGVSLQLGHAELATLLLLRERGGDSSRAITP